MTAKEAYDKAVENLPAKLEKEAKEQAALIAHIYKLIELAAENGLMFFITEPLKKKYAGEELTDKLQKDGFKCEYMVAEQVELTKLKISWEHDHT